MSNLSMPERKLRHDILKQKTAAWEALQWCRKFFPWRCK